MNVETITMDPALAREKLRATRTRLHRQADEEYRALEAGYAALAAGTPLINLPEAMRSGGIGEDGRPRFAFARADRRRVHFSWSGRRTAAFDAHSRDGWSRRGPASPALVQRFSFDGVAGTPRTWDEQRGLDATALVPLVPPEIRLHDPGNLRRRWILWEVEVWEPVPPTDPMLLKHIGGDLYAVTGAWDLAPLEQAVMAGRARV